jgi:hypothetical protein
LDGAPFFIIGVVKIGWEGDTMEKTPYVKPVIEEEKIDLEALCFIPSSGGQPS